MPRWWDNCYSVKHCHNFKLRALWETKIISKYLFSIFLNLMLCWRLLRFTELSSYIQSCICHNKIIQTKSKRREGLRAKVWRKQGPVSFKSPQHHTAHTQSHCWILKYMKCRLGTSLPSFIEYLGQESAFSLVPIFQTHKRKEDG